MENYKIENCNNLVVKFKIQRLKSDRFRIGAEMDTRPSLHWTLD